MYEQAIDSFGHTEAQKLCSLTKRVMIISPLPERVNGLFVSLTTACYDVFSLHEFNEGLLSSLKPELIVYDALPLTSSPDYIEMLNQDQTLLRIATNYPIPLVVLLDESSYSRKAELMLDRAEVIAWPSSAELVMERMDAMLENQTGFAKSDDFIMYKDLKIDVKRMIVMKDNQRIELTKTEYDLLLHFLTSDGSVQTRELLLDIIWGLQFYAGSNVVDVHIKSLRKKIEDSAVDPKYIATVRGVGYRLADI
ncbi:DNA-binding response regulator [Paenibacillus septentrionalis]|uniref:DNA-binding response regulator n=1 Tax=Paenibacillus septentrionalis TaxID=429342 RepID=A0ABW1V6W6_9BACL